MSDEHAAEFLCATRLDARPRARAREQAARPLARRFWGGAGACAVLAARAQRSLASRSSAEVDGAESCAPEKLASGHFGDFSGRFRAQDFGMLRKSGELASGKILYGYCRGDPIGGSDPTGLGGLDDQPYLPSGEFREESPTLPAAKKAHAPAPTSTGGLRLDPSSREIGPIGWQAPPAPAIDLRAGPAPAWGTHPGLRIDAGPFFQNANAGPQEVPYQTNEREFLQGLALWHDNPLGVDETSAQFIYERAGLVLPIRQPDLFDKARRMAAITLYGGLRAAYNLTPIGAGEEIVEGIEEGSPGKIAFGAIGLIPVGRLAGKVGRFFWDPRSWGAVSREYWAVHRGARLGRSLDHWLISRSAKLPQWAEGFRNAGFNLVVLPRSTWLTRGYFAGDINRFMGMAAQWSGHALQNYALRLRGVVTLGIPVLAGGSFAGGYAVGSGLAHYLDDDE